MRENSDDPSSPEPETKNPLYTEFENEKAETGSLPVVIVKQEDGRVVKVIEQSLSGTQGSLAESEISSTNVITQHK